MSGPINVVALPSYKNQGLNFWFNEIIGVGEESTKVLERFKDTYKHSLTPVSRICSDPATRFYELKQEWEEDTFELSSITDISMHPAYQQIIGMGPVAIPFIISELITKPNHWFWALKSITGEDPVPANKRGKMRDMALAWIHWWIERKYEIIK